MLLVVFSQVFFLDAGKTWGNIKSKYKKTIRRRKQGQLDNNDETEDPEDEMIELEESEEGGDDDYAARKNEQDEKDRNLEEESSFDATMNNLEHIVMGETLEVSEALGTTINNLYFLAPEKHEREEVVTDTAKREEEEIRRIEEEYEMSGNKFPNL